MGCYGAKAEREKGAQRRKMRRPGLWLLATPRDVVGAFLPLALTEGLVVGLSLGLMAATVGLRPVVVAIVICAMGVALVVVVFLAAVAVLRVIVLWAIVGVAAVVVAFLVVVVAFLVVVVVFLVVVVVFLVVVVGAAVVVGFLLMTNSAGLERGAESQFTPRLFRMLYICCHTLQK